MLFRFLNLFFKKKLSFDCIFLAIALSSPSLGHGWQYPPFLSLLHGGFIQHFFMFQSLFLIWFPLQITTKFCICFSNFVFLVGYRYYQWAFWTMGRNTQFTSACLESLVDHHCTVCIHICREPKRYLDYYLRTHGTNGVETSEVDNNGIAVIVESPPATRILFCEGGWDRTTPIDRCNHNWVRLQYATGGVTVLGDVGGILKHIGIKRQNLHSILSTQQPIVNESW